MIEQASLVLGNGNWAVKSDSLLGYKTIDGKYYPRDMTFTRATTGTRVNEAGLVELVPYNLLQRSEEFDNAIWTKTTASVVANATTSPIGTLTADNLIPNAVTFGLVQQTANITANVPNTFSIYVKYNGISTFQLQTRDNANNANVALVFFNVLTGVISVAPSASGAYSNASADIESVGNGWYRLSLTSTSNISVTSKFRLVGDLSDGVNGYFIWGAQLVEGTQPLDYLPTTDRLDIARIDYSTGEPVLLLEPQRTNLALQSSSFDNTTTWINGIGGTGVNPIRTANAIISPSGIQDADTIVFDRGAGNTLSDQSIINQQITIATTGTYYFSVWLKATASGDIGKQVFIRCGNAAALQAVTLTANWVRYETTASVTAGSNGFQVGSRGTITTSNSVSVDLWGAQLEAGSYATSYIPTTSATVTRNQEVCLKTGASALIGQTEGTLYAEFNLTNLVGDKMIFEIGADNSNRIRMRVNGNTISANVILAGSIVASIPFFSQPLGNYKFAYAYKQNDFQAYLNGNAGTAVTSGNIPSSMSIIGVGTRIVTADIFNDSISTAALWKERLSDSELATLTTL